MEPTYDLEHLFEHTDFLRRLARGLIGDEHRAEDLIQEAYVTALTRAPRDREAQRGWLGAVVRNRAINALRSESRRAGRERAAARSEPSEASDEAASRIEIQRKLLERVLALPPQQRTVVYLRFYEGLMPRAIAARTGAPVKTVNTRIARGLANLRKQLDAEVEGGRERWLAAVAPLAVSKTSGPVGLVSGGTLVGGLAMKKLLAVGVFVLLSALAWRGLVREGSAPQRIEAQVAEAVAPEVHDDDEESPAADTTPIEPTRTSRIPALAPLTVEERTCRIDLEVLRHDGSPAAGLVVGLSCREDSPRDQLRYRPTDESGRVRFDRLPAGRTGIWVDRGFMRSETLEPGDDLTLTWTLPRGLDVVGRVVDANESPVAEAEVWIDGSRGYWPRGTPAEGTDENGSFRLDGLSDQAQLIARKRGRQPSAWLRVAHLPADPSGVRRLTLHMGEPGSNIDGLVLDPDGEPVAGALVHAGPRGGHSADTLSGVSGEAPTPAIMKTDTEGRFALPDGFPVGQTPIHVMASGYPTWAGTVEVGRAGSGQVEIRLERAAVIEGRVVDATGAPAAGAKVICARLTYGGRYHHVFPPVAVKTDRDGRYRLELVPPGPQEINVTGADRRLGRASAQVTCVARERIELNLTLDPGPSISGRVEDPTGRPLSGKLLWARPAGHGQWGSRSDKTDESGGFLLTNVGEMPYEVSVVGQGAATLAKARALPGQDDVVLVVDPAAAPSGFVTGYVNNADRSVPIGASVTIWPESDEAGFFIGLDEQTGAFRHGPIASGTYRIKVGPGGGFRTALVSASFEVAPHDTTDVGTLIVEPAGFVEVLPGAFPITEMARIGLGLRRDGYTSESDPELVDGRLISGELAPGTWLLTCSERELHVYQEVQVVSGRTTVVEVEVQRALRIPFELEIADDTWSTVEVRVHAANGAPQARETWRRPQVGFRPRPYLLHLPVGPATVIARTDTGLEATAEVVIESPPAARQPLTLRLE